MVGTARFRRLDIGLAFTRRLMVFIHGLIVFFGILENMAGEFRFTLARAESVCPRLGEHAGCGRADVVSVQRLRADVHIWPSRGVYFAFASRPVSPGVPF